MEAAASADALIILLVEESVFVSAPLPVAPFADDVVDEVVVLVDVVNCVAVEAILSKHVRHSVCEHGKSFGKCSLLS